MSCALVTQPTPEPLAIRFFRDELIRVNHQSRRYVMLTNRSKSSPSSGSTSSATPNSWTRGHRPRDHAGERHSRCHRVTCHGRGWKGARSSAAGETTTASVNIWASHRSGTTSEVFPSSCLRLCLEAIRRTNKSETSLSIMHHVGLVRSPFVFFCDELLCVNHRSSVNPTGMEDINITIIITIDD